MLQTLAVIWSDRFDTNDWMQHPSVRNNGDWGLKNIEAIATGSDKFSKVLRVGYLAGEASPTVTRTRSKTVPPLEPRSAIACSIIS